MLATRLSAFPQFLVSTCHLHLPRFSFFFSFSSLFLLLSYQALLSSLSSRADSRTEINLPAGFDREIILLIEPRRFAIVTIVGKVRTRYML